MLDGVAEKVAEVPRVGGNRPVRVARGAPVDCDLQRAGRGRRREGSRGRLVRACVGAGRAGQPGIERDVGADGLAASRPLARRAVRGAPPVPGRIEQRAIVVEDAAARVARDRVLLCDVASRVAHGAPFLEDPVAGVVSERVARDRRVRGTEACEEDRRAAATGGAPGAAASPTVQRARDRVARERVPVGAAADLDPGERTVGDGVVDDGVVVDLIVRAIRELDAGRLVRVRIADAAIRDRVALDGVLGGADADPVADRAADRVPDHDVSGRRLQIALVGDQHARLGQSAARLIGRAVVVDVVALDQVVRAAVHGDARHIAEDLVVERLGAARREALRIAARERDADIAEADPVVPDECVLRDVVAFVVLVPAEAHDRRGAAALAAGPLAAVVTGADQVELADDLVGAVDGELREVYLRREGALVVGGADQAQARQRHGEVVLVVRPRGHVDRRRGIATGGLSVVGGVQRVADLRERVGSDGERLVVGAGDGLTVLLACPACVHEIVRDARRCDGDGLRNLIRAPAVVGHGQRDGVRALRGIGMRRRDAARVVRVVAPVPVVAHDLAVRIVRIARIEVNGRVRCSGAEREGSDRLLVGRADGDLPVGLVNRAGAVGGLQGHQVRERVVGCGEPVAGTRPGRRSPVPEVPEVRQARVVRCGGRVGERHEPAVVAAAVDRIGGRVGERRLRARGCKRRLRCRRSPDG